MIVMTKSALLLMLEAASRRSIGDAPHTFGDMLNNNSSGLMMLESHGMLECQVQRSSTAPHLAEQKVMPFKLTPKGDAYLAKVLSIREPIERITWEFPE